MKNFKIIVLAILMIISLILSAGTTFATVNIPEAPTTDIYVQDYANIISPEVESQLLEKAHKLNEDTKGQIVFVTIKSLEGSTIDEYANELARKWGIGSREYNNGVLVLVSLAERKVRIEVATGLEGRITDVRATDIRKNIMGPYLSKDDFNNAFLKGFDALEKDVRIEYTAVTTSKEESTPAKDSNNTDIIIAIIIFIVSIIVISSIISYKREKRLEREKELKHKEEIRRRQEQERKAQELAEKRRKELLEQSRRLEEKENYTVTDHRKVTSETVSEIQPPKKIQRNTSARISPNRASKNTDNVSASGFEVAAAAVSINQEQERQRQEEARRRRECEEEEERARRKRREEEEEERRQRDSWSSSSSSSWDSGSSWSSDSFGGSSSFDGGGSSGDF
jgi:uncharacterized protein